MPKRRKRPAKKKVPPDWSLVTPKQGIEIWGCQGLRQRLRTKELIRAAVQPGYWISATVVRLDGPKPSAPVRSKPRAPRGGRKRRGGRGR